LTFAPSPLLLLRAPKGGGGGGGKVSFTHIIFIIIFLCGKETSSSSPLLKISEMGERQKRKKLSSSSSSRRRRRRRRITSSPFIQRFDEIYRTTTTHRSRRRPVDVADLFSRDERRRLFCEKQGKRAKKYAKEGRRCRQKRLELNDDIKQQREWTTR